MNLKLKLAIHNIIKQKQTTSNSLLALVVAFVIASPLAYFIINKWFEKVAFKTTLSWWTFAVASFLVLGIAMLSVNWSRMRRERAAKRNPMETLRHK